MADLVVRLADIEDTPALARLRRQFDAEYPEFPSATEMPLDRFTQVFTDYYAGLIEEDRVAVMVADDDGEIVSNAWIIKVDRVPRPRLSSRGQTHPLGYVTNVFTSPSYRGSGIGAQVMSPLIDYARLVPIETLVVWPSEGSVEFYRRLGFRSGPVSDADDDGHIGPMEMKLTIDDLRAQQRRKVFVVDYDPLWPSAFEVETDKIRAAIGDWAEAVEHIGSTSVAGLGAKPIIDIMVGLRRLPEFKKCIRPLRDLAYVHKPWADAGLPDRRYFSKDTEGIRSHHLHMTVIGGTFWNKHLAFRDYLRANPDSAARYFELKKQLATKFESDTIGYTDAKTDFIEYALRDAGFESSS